MKRFSMLLVLRLLAWATEREIKWCRAQLAGTAHRICDAKNYLSKVREEIRALEHPPCSNVRLFRAMSYRRYQRVGAPSFHDVH